MSLTKVLFAFASITVCAASLPCYATLVSVPSSSVKLSIPATYSDRAIFATFTPPGGLTLTAYAKEFGNYTGFDWQQTITNWPSPNLHCYKCGPGGTSMLIVPTVPTGTFPAFLDLPPTGYTYNPCGGPAPGSAGMANPVYFTPTGNIDCWSLARNETSTTGSFSDEPFDPELTSTEISANNIPKFKTALVAINTSGEALTVSSPLFAWTWESTYNGSASGTALIAAAANSPVSDPGFGGTGSVTITGICQIRRGEAQPGCEGHGSGDPLAAIPEPPGSLLLASGMLAILAARKMVRSKKLLPHPI